MITRAVTPASTPVQHTANDDAARAVIVIQEAFGVNDHIRNVTERFAEHGFFAVAPELFHRTGSPEIPYDNFPDAMSAVGTLTATGIHDDLMAAADFLAGRGFSRESVGIVGYCMGGSVSFYAATLDIVGGAVSFYGGGVENGRFGLPSLLELAPALRCAWLGLYGDLDKGIPVEQVEQLRAATATTSYDTQIVRYADAEHGFNCAARPAVYNEAAAHDATRRTYDFFTQHLRAR